MKRFSILPIACSGILFATCNSTANHNLIISEEIFKESGIEHSVYKDLQGIVANGIKMHFEYNFKDKEQFKICHTNNPYPNEQKESILLRIKKITDTKKKKELELITQNALHCAECGSNLYSCSQAAVSINKLHHAKNSTKQQTKALP